MFILFVMTLGESNWIKYSVWHLVYVMRDLSQEVEHIYDGWELLSIPNSLNPGMFSIDPTTILRNRKASKTCRHSSSIFSHVYDSTLNHYKLQVICSTNAEQYFY